MPGIGADDPQPDAEAGLRRARAATTLMLALPGSAYLYQGEELGLPEATELPDELRQDPTWESPVAPTVAATVAGSRSRGWRCAVVRLRAVGEVVAAAARVYGELAVDRQTGVQGSTLELYRELLRRAGSTDSGAAS